jgi:hypothetical protein
MACRNPCRQKGFGRERIGLPGEFAEPVKLADINDVSNIDKIVNVLILDIRLGGYVESDDDIEHPNFLNVFGFESPGFTAL